MRPQLRRRAAQRIGGLARVPALNALPASPAASDMHPKPDVVHPRFGNFRLVLIDQLSFAHVAAAVRTAGGQFRFQGFIHAGRNRTSDLRARKVPLGPRCSQGFLQFAPQPVDLLAKLLVVFPTLLVFALQPGDLFGVGFLRQGPDYQAPPTGQVTTMEQVTSR